MNKEELAGRLREETRCVQVSPQLRRRTLDAASGKEKHIMKRKISAAAVFALLAVTICAVAIAAANRWGILDFVGRYADAYIPEDAASYVQTDVLQMQDERFRVNVREQYYDGRTVRFVIDVTPTDKKTLLTGVDTMLSDSWQNLLPPQGEWDETDERTVLDVIHEAGYTSVYSVNVWTEDQENGGVCGAMDYRLSEDGTLTIFMQEEYDDDRPVRSGVIKAGITPYVFPLEEESLPDYDQRILLEQAIELTAVQDAASAPAADGTVPGVYVSVEPVEYPSVGVRVDQLRIEVKPQEIYAIVDFTVTDEETHRQLYDGLWFEFIDPEKPGEAWEQRLASGLSGGGGVYSMDDVHYQQKETLGKNELHETYTLRAFECWDKQRFETHEIAVRPATAEDLP